MKHILPISILIITVYLLTNLIVPVTFRGEIIFLADVILWAVAIATTLLISKHQHSRTWRTNKTTLQLAAVIATLQISLSVFASFFMGFGKNPNVWTPSTLTIYLPYLLAPFLAIETSRAYLAQTTSKRKPTLALLLISLFYTLITVSIPKYTSLTTPLAISEFLIKTFIPTLAVSLLATYFAFLGGFPANLTYMAIPALLTWFSPILPNPPKQTQSMTTVIATTIGFLVLDQTVKPPPTRKTRRTIKKQKSQLPYWTAITLIGLIAVWSSTGLLGFTPTIIATGSMQPTLKPGDITIIISTPSNTLKPGDIIQYHTADAPITHRVINTYVSEGSRWFITKGDANNAPDNPVNERQLIGKVMFTIPQLGWISITLKHFAANTYTFLTKTLPQTLTTAWMWITTNGVYTTSVLTFTAYTYLLLTYKSHRKEGKTQKE
ncbi:MAG: signal peptidase I [Thermoproteota archaeon]|nr:signal peptidase I [Thermoproteota archaeon]